MITTTSQLHKKSYVDDLLKSIQDEQTAIKLIKHKRAVCAEEGFYFAKFLSNRKVIFFSIPDHSGFGFLTILKYIKQGVMVNMLPRSFFSKTKKDKNIATFLTFLNICHENLLEQQFQIV